MRLVRNPIYCGKIPIPKYKDEEACWVKGIHEPLISEGLFYEVQDVLEGKKKSFRTKILSEELLPLKGYIHCSKCTRALCGSASKGRSQYYHYYHCSSKCGCRYKADIINKEFLAFLSDYEPNSKAAELFKMVIFDAYANDTVEFKDYKIELAKRLTTLNNKLSKARELLLTGDIEGADYKEIRTDCERKIAITEEEIAASVKNRYSKSQLEPIIDRAFLTFANLNAIYCKSGAEEKRRLIGLMFPEKFTFENIKHRTAKVRPAFRCIYLINSQLKGKKKGAKDL